MASSSKMSKHSADHGSTKADGGGPTVGESGLKTEKEQRKYLEVYKSAIRGDWESGKRLLEQDEDALTDYVNRYKETVLQRAVANTSEAGIYYVEKLVELMSNDALALQDVLGYTALSVAAQCGNTKAAMILVNKNPALLYMKNNTDNTPVHLAAFYARKKTLLYLINATIQHHPPTTTPYQDQSAGVRLLVQVIRSGFVDVALDLVRRDSDLAKFTNLSGIDHPLTAIAQMPSAFPSGSHLNYWQRFIYARIPVKWENKHTITNPIAGDIENSADNTQVFPLSTGRGTFFVSVGRKLQVLLAKVMELVSPVKHLQEQKLRHHQALQLVKCLCKGFYSSGDDGRIFMNNAAVEAIRLGIHEVLEHLFDTYPMSVWSLGKDHRYIFHVAVLNRHENVFNLIYQMGELRQLITALRDESDNNILHLAGKLAPPHKLNLVSGAALQMQRELQWFKEVEKFVIPTYKERENKENKTPAMVFSEEHKDLVKEVEKWMKDTANSCTIAAALIATVVFAAAITVPGGNNANGLPFFTKEIGFIVFAVSDAISLFTSTSSLLMFLSILTSRYAEQDFLYSLPRRLIIGLVTLFLSITFMMITFSATVYLVFGHKKAWILIPVAALSCLPVSLFVSLQFPLLVDVVSSTYGPGIFGKKGEKIFF